MCLNLSHQSNSANVKETLQCVKKPILYVKETYVIRKRKLSSSHTLFLSFCVCLSPAHTLFCSLCICLSLSRSNPTAPMTKRPCYALKRPTSYVQRDVRHTEKKALSLTHSLFLFLFLSLFLALSHQSNSANEKETMLGAKETYVICKKRPTSYGKKGSLTHTLSFSPSATVSRPHTLSFSPSLSVSLSRSNPTAPM